MIVGHIFQRATTRQRCVVHDTVAIIINGITHLSQARPRRRVNVIAVPVVVPYIPRVRLLSLTPRDRLRGNVTISVTIPVQIVAIRLRRTALKAGAVLCALNSSAVLCTRTPLRGEVLVNLDAVVTRAVVIDAVAQLWLVRGTPIIRVIAVERRPRGILHVLRPWRATLDGDG